MLPFKAFEGWKCIGHNSTSDDFQAGVGTVSELVLNGLDHFSKGNGGRAVWFRDNTVDTVIASTYKPWVKGQRTKEGNAKFFGGIFSAAFLENVQGY